MRICPYCGAEQQSRSIYCEECGQLLPALQEKNLPEGETTPSNPAKHPFRFWFFFLILIPILLIIGLFFYVKQFPDTMKSSLEDPNTIGAYGCDEDGTRVVSVLYDCEDTPLLSDLNEGESAGLLSVSQLHGINEQLQTVYETIQMPIGVRIGNIPMADAQAARERAISDFQAEFPEAESGVWLYLDAYEPEAGETYETQDYFLTYGAAQLYYTNADDLNRIEVIFDLMNSETEEQTTPDLYQRLKRFGAALLMYYQAGIPEGYYVYDSDADLYLYEENGVIDWRTEKPAVIR